MKRTIFSLLLIAMSSAFVFSSTGRNEVKDDIQDRIELGREGGTTRIASASRMFSIQSVAAEPVVEAFNYRNVITISVQNYRGTALVEIIGKKRSKTELFRSI